MGLSPRKKKSKLLLLIVGAVIVVLVTSAVLYRLYAGTSASSQLNDPSNDVVLSAGTRYPGMIDVVSGTLEANGTMLNVTINVRDSFSSLGDGETAQWNVTVILENQTDVLKTYVISVEMNSTELTGSIVDVDTLSVQSCQVQYYRNSLTVLAVVNELPRARTIEWNVLTLYEQYSGGELVTSATDLAPDEGLQTTALTP
jgi:hypothetical protein